jgi:peptidoglycan/LPS O-acetylase OafA/YrhL
VAATAAATGAPSPAVAPPPGNPRFPLFDSLRGIAVLAVLVFHVFLVTGALERPVFGDLAASFGNLGPIVFFAISGFLLYRPFVAAREGSAPAPGARRYLARRALRILPAYWFALTVLAVFPGIVGVFTGDWWRFYGFLQAYSLQTLSQGIPVAWTLCVEVTFYLALPLWGLALRRARPAADLAALTALAACGVAVQVAASRLEVSHLVGQSLLGQCTWMAIGMALAVVSVKGPGSRRLWAAIRRPGLCWAVAAAALVGLAVLRSESDGILGIVAAVSTPQPIAETLAGIALTGLVVAGLLVPAVFDERAAGVPRAVLAWAPLAGLGIISYGVYLWHLTIAEFVALPSAPQHFSASGLDLVGELPFLVTPVVFAVVLVLSCAVAAASYRFVELPFLRRKAR